MPKVMKEKAISVLEGGIEAYLLGLCGLSLPINWNRKKANAKYAPVIGLFGTAVELIVKACLVQAKGIEVMYKNEDISAGVYKNATEIIAEFKVDLIKNNRCIDYVWENKKDIQEQQRKLIYYLDKFHLLQDLRAKGLHAGIGCSRDIAVVISNEIYDFINILARGKKLKAYLKHIPAPEATVRDREAIIEDLSRRLHMEVDNNEKIGYLRNMYMVLPYIPEIEPEWMRIFKRIEIVPPTKDDVNYLVKTLEDAHSIYLLKARGGKEGIPVKVEPKNPNALPIAIQNMKRVLSNIPDEFHNDALTANTRFEKGILDLPIKDFLIDLYALGLEEAGIVKQNEKLTAQQIWSFIVSAYSINGTPYPCWEFVRRCDELDKLIAILEKTKSMGSAYWKKRADTVIKCVIAIKKEKAVCLDKEKDKVELMSI